MTTKSPSMTRRSLITGSTMAASTLALAPSLISRAEAPWDGCIFVGDKGKMLVNGWGGESPRLIPEARDKEYQRPPKTLPRSVGHHKRVAARLSHGFPNALEL